MGEKKVNQDFKELHYSYDYYCLLMYLVGISTALKYKIQRGAIEEIINQKSFPKRKKST